MTNISIDINLLRGSKGHLAKQPVHLIHQLYHNLYFNLLLAYSAAGGMDWQSQCEVHGTLI